MWLSNEILTWIAESSTSSIEDTKVLLRPYEIWEHAAALLTNPTTNFHLVDAITTLKRALDQRIRQLRNLYRFDEIPVGNKPKRIIEQLAHFGIVRPTMLEQLMLLRNQIEHADAPPPDQARCLEFLDFA